MNLRDIDAEIFVPLGHNRKALLVERVGKGYEGTLIIPTEHTGAAMSSGIEPPVLSHYLPKKCKVLAIGPNVRGIKVGDIINVPGAGNCYADLEDGTGEGSRLLIREGDIAGVYEASAHREIVKAVVEAKRRHPSKKNQQYDPSYQ